MTLMALCQALVRADSWINTDESFASKNQLLTPLVLGIIFYYPGPNMNIQIYGFVFLEFFLITALITFKGPVLLSLVLS